MSSLVHESVCAPKSEGEQLRCAPAFLHSVFVVNTSRLRCCRLVTKPLTWEKNPPFAHGKIGFFASRSCKLADLDSEAIFDAFACKSTIKRQFGNRCMQEGRDLPTTALILTTDQRANVVSASCWTQNAMITHCASKSATNQRKQHSDADSEAHEIQMDDAPYTHAHAVAFFR